MSAYRFTSDDRYLWKSAQSHVYIHLKHGHSRPLKAAYRWELCVFLQMLFSPTDPTQQTQLSATVLAICLCYQRPQQDWHLSKGLSVRSGPVLCVLIWSHSQVSAFGSSRFGWDQNIKVEYTILIYKDTTNNISPIRCNVILLQILISAENFFVYLTCTFIERGDVYSSSLWRYWLKTVA